MSRCPLAILCIPLIVGCGSVSKSPPLDASDTSTPTDTSSEIPLEDTVITDTVHADTTVADTTPADVPGDDADVPGDPVDEEVLDAPDLPDGWPTDNPADWPYSSSPQCRGQGGFCSGGSAILCPWGYEPLRSSDPVRRCDYDGWCCIVAAYSECTDSGTASCFFATACSGVLGGCLIDATPAMDCETGRVCCVDSCG